MSKEKAFDKTIEHLARAKASLLNSKLSDYDDKNHVNNALDALLCIDNAISVLSIQNE